MVGIGAGVGYGVGSWIADKFQKNDSRNGQMPGNSSVEQMPWAVQVGLQQWQEFVLRRNGAGRQLSAAEVDALWAEFEQIEPTHAMNARALVRGGMANPRAGQTPVMTTQGGVTVVAPVAAE